MNSVDLSPLELDPRRLLRREMPRPPNLRQADYEEKFDALTVFYDCFRSIDGTSLVFIGPPLFNLEGVVVPLLERLVPPAPSNPERQSSLTRSDERMNSSQLWFRTDAAGIEIPPGLFLQSRIDAQPNQSDLFLARRVLLTQSKNNELAWIHDWAHFFAHHHGCDAVLFYDNASTKYDAAAVYDAISSVPGIEVVVVVHWPFKLGPPGSEPGRGQQDIPWDSNYLQLGRLEHARNRFLGRAEAVVNADVDELVLTTDMTSVFDLVRRSETGYLRYPGYWIESATESVGQDLRHVDFSYRSKVPGGSYMRKWAVVPSRSEPRDRWVLHAIAGMKADATSRLVSYRHFRAISTGWKYSRGTTQRPNTLEHFKDDELVPWMQIFDQIERGALATIAHAVRRLRRRLRAGAAIERLVRVIRRTIATRLK